MEAGFVAGVLEKFIGSAERLGVLSSSSVWAFFCLVLLAYIFVDSRYKRKASEQAWNARLEEANADHLMAQAVEKMAEQIRELRYSLNGRNKDV